MQVQWVVEEQSVKVQVRGQRNPFTERDREIVRVRILTMSSLLLAVHTLLYTTINGTYNLHVDLL